MISKLYKYVNTTCYIFPSMRSKEGCPSGLAMDGVGYHHSPPPMCIFLENTHRPLLEKEGELIIITKPLCFCRRGLVE